MRAFKLFVINAVTLIIGLGLVSGLFAQGTAQAARFESTPSIKVNKLGNMNGQYLTALYAVGSRPLIATDSSQITISQVKESRTIYITGDTMTLPKVQVEKEGFRPSYNIVVFIVSPQQNYSWVNADGTVPQGVTKTSNHQSSMINAINKTEVDEFVKKSGEDSVMQVELAK